MKLVIVILGLYSTISFSNELKPFFTDGCTMFVDGTKERPGLWRHCCVEHDLRYWFGGSQKDLDSTDLRLKSCVNDVAGPTWAELIYVGVRMGHHSPVKNKTHWSWGWVNERKNTDLNVEEINYVIDELHRLPLDPEMIEQFIKQNFKIKNVKI